MAISRRQLKCKTCGTKTVTRAAIGHGDYQEFAFPCSGCGTEIRFGMKLIQKEAKKEYVKLENAVWADEEEESINVRTFDGETLVPVKEGEHFSPFMATFFIVRDPQKFRQHQGMRMRAAEVFWPQLAKLLIHLERKNWNLFDAQMKELAIAVDGSSEAERTRAAFNALGTLASHTPNRRPIRPFYRKQTAQRNWAPFGPL